MHMFNVWIIIMQSSNIKEWKLLELQINQARHPLSIHKPDTLLAFYRKKSFKTPKNEKKNHEMYTK